MAENDQKTAKVLYPNGGEVFPVKSESFVVTFTPPTVKQNYSVALVDTAGKIYTLVSSVKGEATDKQTVSISTAMFAKLGVKDGQYKIRIITKGETNVYDESDNYFTLTNTNTPIVVVAGSCGTASKTYTAGETSFGDLTICKTGTPSPSPSFPGVGTSQTWKCLGINGGATSGVCTAKNNSQQPLNLISNLQPGQEGEEVSLLQRSLRQLGLYTGPITGFFGGLTQKAVSQFQTANSLDAVGEVGPKTRQLLNYVFSL